jgi:glc operon protein GlcG
MSRFTAFVTACAALIFSAQASAQQLAPLPPGVPEKMPFDIPYGAPISMDAAKKLVEASLAESTKRGWKMAVAVVSPSGDLIYFAKMDDTLLVAAEIAPRKARTAAKFRRDTKLFFDQIETGHPFVATLDPSIVASPGGLPIVVGGKLIGGIGCSGGVNAQDAWVCQAGIDSIGK